MPIFAGRDPDHYLKPLTTTTTPKRMLWLDCTARKIRRDGAYVDLWGCGALGSSWYTSKRGELRYNLNTYQQPAELWQAASDFCPVHRRVVMFCYDLPYQLRVSQALLHLPALGWHLQNIVLEHTAAWAVLHNGDRTLLCCDLKSWCPVDLGSIEGDVAETGVTFPAVNAGPNYPAERSSRRVGIVREAVMQILAWIDGEQLGPFRPTGSGQSYAAYRRRFLTHSPLVHDDETRLVAERAGMHTGRCEAWNWGVLNAGPYVEYDMHAAYCHIARDCELPAKAGAMYRAPSRATVERLMLRKALLAECVVTTDIPCVPTQLGGRTLWPVGTFQTTLYDPEIRLALENATDVRFDRVWTYDRGPVLRDFAGFVLDGLGAGAGKYGPVPQRVLKHWSRCLVGRLGLRYRSWQKFGEQDPPDLRLITYVDVDADHMTDILCAGRDRLILTDMLEAAESLPQIPGWVMSECRRRLWEAMRAWGLRDVVYVDTDSVMVRAGVSTPELFTPTATDTATWARKGVCQQVLIHGPRNLECNTSRRVSGVPRTATQVGPLEFDGIVMRSIRESMTAGELDCVTNLPRKFVMSAPDLRRQHLPGGTTAPYTINTQSGG